MWKHPKHVQGARLPSWGILKLLISCGPSLAPIKCEIHGHVVPSSALSVAVCHLERKPVTTPKTRSRGKSAIMRYPKPSYNLWTITCNKKCEMHVYVVPSSALRLEICYLERKHVKAPKTCSRGKIAIMRDLKPSYNLWTITCSNKMWDAWSCGAFICFKTGNMLPWTKACESTQNMFKGQDCHHEVS